MPKAEQPLENALSTLTLGVNTSVLIADSAQAKGCLFRVLADGDLPAASRTAAKANSTPAGIGAAIAGGTIAGTDTYTLTTTVAYTAYAAGDILKVKFTNANSGAATLNVNSLGAKAIQYLEAALSAARIPAKAHAFVYYDGTAFQLMGYWGA